MKLAAAGICMLVAVATVAGCSKKSSSRKSPPPTAEGAAAVDPRKPILEQPLAGETRLGETVATLGDPTQPGFWLRTPLVSASSKGRIVNEKGASVQVDLLPTGDERGVGSMMSLAAMRLLGGSLTDLPQITVFALD